MSGELIVDRLRPDNVENKLTINGNIEVEGSIQTSTQSPGSIIQVIGTQSNNPITSSNPIPWSNDKPVKTQGVEVLSAEITPHSQYSKFLIEATIHAVESSNHSDHITLALFKGEDDEALACSCEEIYGDLSAYGGYLTTIPFKHIMEAGTINPITFKLRAGCNIGTIYINHFNEERKLGGTLFSTLTMTEIA